MSKFSVAMLQISACGNNQDENRKIGIEACRHAHAMGADIAVFPEMWNVGYTPDENEGWANPSKHAITTNSDFFRAFAELAKELQMGIALTYLEDTPTGARNTVSIIDKRGNTVLTFAKVHLCEFIGEAHLEPGDDFFVCDFDNLDGQVKLGAAICYDLGFPETATILMLKGAELILFPMSSSLNQKKHAQLQTRAADNAVGLVVVNYPAKDIHANNAEECGKSIAFDAEANKIVEAGIGDSIHLAEFDLGKLRNFRESTFQGNAFRKPHRYGLLTSMAVAPPFIRKDSRGRDFDRAKR